MRSFFLILSLYLAYIEYYSKDRHFLLELDAGTIHNLLPTYLIQLDSANLWETVSFITMCTMQSTWFRNDMLHETMTFATSRNGKHGFEDGWENWK